MRNQNSELQKTERPSTDKDAEAGSDSIESKTAKLEADFFMKNQAKPVEGGERQKAMLKFMDSLESELGVPREDFVEAMGNLTPTQLFESPEKTVTATIEQLDLSSEDAAKAQAMYAGLLQDLKSPRIIPVETFGGLSAGVLAAKEHQERLNQTVDQLNAKFFMVGQSPKGGPTPAVLQGNSILAEGASFQDTAGAGAQAGVHGGALVNGKQIPLPESAMLQRPEAANNELLLRLKNLQQASGRLEESFQPTASSTGQFAGPMAVATAAGAQGADLGNDEGAGSGNDSLPKEAALGGTPFGKESLGKASEQFFPSAAAAAGTGLAASARSQEMNIQQIMNQTQYMIKQGGGEATVKLSPEGMGEIQLKVSLMEGRVNVEIATETKEAKKMLESSLGDLRTHLGQHKLSVDSIRVDVGSQAGLDLSQQNQPDAKQDGREQAQKFFQQFRDEGSLGQRSNFWEMPGLRAQQAYGRQPQPLQPETVRSASRRDYGATKGRGLDLVA